MIFLLDNYDSFTYNLYQFMRELGADVRVARNDKVTVAEVMAMAPAAVVLSPGPGRPAGAGIAEELVRGCARRRVPMLGVCLGHQALGEVFGGEVVAARTLMHGKMSDIAHDGETVFAGLESPLRVMRYHSLVVAADSVPRALAVSATCGGEVMAMRHRELPLEGVQFHPESIMTAGGRAMLRNFMDFYLGGGSKGSKMVDSGYSDDDILNVIGYGLAKFDKAFVAAFGYRRNSDFYRFLIEQGVAKTAPTIWGRRDLLDPFFDNGRRGWVAYGERYLPRKLHFDSLFGELDAVQFARMVQDLLARGRGGVGGG